MNDEWDDARNDFIDELYGEFTKEVLDGHGDLYGLVISSFISERLHSYYLQTPRVLERARWAFSQARNLLTAHPEAALVFAVSATEIGLRSGLLKPILHGLIHDETLAAVVVKLIPERRDSRAKELLFGILREYGGVDLQNFKRVGVAQTLWNEIDEIQRIRNGIVHNGEASTQSDAERALAIAEVVLLELYPTVLCTIGLNTFAHEAKLPPP